MPKKVSIDDAFDFITTIRRYRKQSFKFKDLPKIIGHQAFEPAVKYLGWVIAAEGDGKGNYVSNFNRIPTQKDAKALLDKYYEIKKAWDESAVKKEKEQKKDNPQQSLDIKEPESNVISMDERVVKDRYETIISWLESVNHNLECIMEKLNIHDDFQKPENKKAKK